MNLHSLGDPGPLITIQDTLLQQLPNPRSLWKLPFLISETCIVKIPHQMQAEIQIIFLGEGYFYKALKEL